MVDSNVDGDPIQVREGSEEPASGKLEAAPAAPSASPLPSEDALDLDGPWEKSELLPSDRIANVPPGFADDAHARSRPYGRVLAFVLLALAIAMGIYGIAQNGKLTQPLRDALPVPAPSTTFVDARNGVILMLEQTGNLSRVVVNQADQAGWILVSRDDTTAAKPALSPDGTKVVYSSKRGKGQIVIVALGSGTPKSITAEQVQKLGGNNSLDDLEICSWTPIAWDPDSSQVAFFGCIERRDLSVVLIGGSLDSDPTLTILTESRMETSVEQQIEWQDAKHLLVITPSSDPQAEPITTVTIP